MLNSFSSFSSYVARWLALPLALLIATPCLAAATPATMTVTQAWARATPPGAETGAAYFTISNTGSKADAIVGAQSAVAANASVHEMKMAGGMMQMRATPNLTIAPQAKVTFTPNGYHVMLEGLKAPLKEGDHFKLTLQLQHAGKMEVDVVVEGFGASQFTPAH
jgi:periplasmic copper chaperone A